MHWITNALDIRPGEGARVTLMTGFIFSVVTCLMVVKPVANSLFLTTFGAQRLPYVFILVAVFAASTSSIYGAWLRRVDIFKLITRTLQTAILSLLIFWAALKFGPARGPILVLLYIWVGVFSLISVSQFWLLANAIFNPREAKRLFSVVGAGAIAGGIAGGYLTKLTAGLLGSANLMLVCEAGMGMCILLTAKLRQSTSDNVQLLRVRRNQQTMPQTQHPLKSILQSSHLMFLAAIIGLSVLVGKLVEFQFSATATARIMDADNLTAFFGFWFSNINILSLVVQLFITRRVVGWMGVGVSLFFLPGTILIGALMVLMQPTLWSAVFLKVGDGSLKNSINKAALELMVLPLPAEVKNQTKSFIDVIIDSTATGLGGLLLLAMTAMFGTSLRWVAGLTILLTGLWLYLVTRIRREYLHTFRLSLAPAGEDHRPAAAALSGRSIYGNLLEALQSDNGRQLMKALLMAQTVQHKILAPVYEELIRHSDPRIRLQALKNSYTYRNRGLRRAARSVLLDPGQQLLEARIEAAHYLFRNEPGNRIATLSAFMRHEDQRVAGAALICAARESRRNQKLKKTFEIRAKVEEFIRHIPGQIQSGDSSLQKIICAGAVGSANIPALYPYLNLFINEKAPEVVKAAILAAGESRHEAFIPQIIDHLDNPDLQSACRDALLCFGTDVTALLGSYLKNPSVARRIRGSIPYTIALMGSQTAADLLVANLDEPDPTLRFEIIRALNQLRAAKPRLKFSDQTIERSILRETKGHLNMLAALQFQINHPQVGNQEIHQLRADLARLIETRLDRNLERIFRLLGLKYPSEDIYQVYQGLHSGKPDLRINAVEFLDNVLDTDLKRTIIPLVETSSVEKILQNAGAHWGLSIPSELEAFELVLPDADSELQLQTLAVITRLNDNAFAVLAAELAGSTDPEVRAAAILFLQKIGYMGESSPGFLEASGPSPLKGPSGDSSSAAGSAGERLPREGGSGAAPAGAVPPADECS